MKYYQKALYDEMTSFYLITCDDEGDKLGRIRSLIGGLVRKARQVIGQEGDDKVRIHQLLQLFYGDWGFHCDPEHYFEAENLYLAYVLETHSGMPVSLGALLLYLADSLKLPLYPVNFPTQLILRAEVDNEVAFIDPWNGHYLSQAHLQKLYEGAFGFGAEISSEELERADVNTLLNRFRQLAKNALIRENRNDAAYRYIASLLRYHPEDPYEIRDRGLVLAQMGCYQAAAEDLQYFVDQCPQDPTSFLLTAQLAELKDHFSELH
ncbi:SirB1 family protein [[Mannheimia] succiniciproducens]|uniref:Protein SirB1 N-terminal domain-containing protein n=1 Tax=Mannheimia succiniciproducens (strain KCTC 0769BP / MBEL55E) TaxID=221988 RepID=Q65TB3_MANSM|nr:SirB1 family protein [[Mannheimia] succiniciproducens]AAU37797.1 unknown [[Mannheimia] succiniciproducens MBEL55E]